MPKPTDSMEWASDGSAQIVEPLEAKKDIGWVVGEKPPAQYFNWWMNNAYLWQQYFEATTDTLLAGSNVLTSTTDITLTIDSDNTSTSNFVVIDHNGTGAEIFKFDESANFRVNTATVGTSGAGVVALKNGTAPSTNVTDVVQLYPADFTAGDSRLFIRSESGGPISIGNNSIRNVNTDGTFTLASEKHITVDIDSDNDGTDGLFTVRANGTTAAMTVTEAGVVTATSTVVGTNINANNLTDLLDVQIKSIFGNMYFMVGTDAEAAAADNLSGTGRRCITGSSSGGAVLDASDGIVSTGDVLCVAANWTTQAGSFADIDQNASHGVAVGSGGILYTTSGTNINGFTSRTSGTANALGYVSGNASYWVAAGNGANNTLRYNTTDPTTAWSASTSGLDGTTTFKGLANNGTRFVAITSDNEVIYTSNPSSSWTLAGTVASIGSCSYLQWVGDYFVAFDGSSTTYYYSTDGITWNSATLGGGLTGANCIYGISIGTSRYIYVAIISSSSPALVYGTSITSISTSIPIGSFSHSGVGTGYSALEYSVSGKRFYAQAGAGLCYSTAHG